MHYLLPIYACIHYPSIQASTIYLCIHLYMHLSIYPSIHASTYPSIHASIYPSIYPSIHPHTHPPTHPPTYLPTYPSVHPPIYLPSTHAPAPQQIFQSCLFLWTNLQHFTIACRQPIMWQWTICSTDCTAVRKKHETLTKFTEIQGVQ